MPLHYWSQTMPGWLVKSQRKLPYSWVVCFIPWKAVCYSPTLTFPPHSIQAVCASNCNSAGGYCRNPGQCLCRSGWTGSGCHQCHPSSGCCECSKMPRCFYNDHFSGEFPISYDWWLLQCSRGVYMQGKLFWCPLRSWLVIHSHPHTPFRPH